MKTLYLSEIIKLDEEEQEEAFQQIQNKEVLFIDDICNDTYKSDDIEITFPEPDTSKMN